MNGVGGIHDHDGQKISGGGGAVVGGEGEPINAVAGEIGGGGESVAVAEE